MKAASKEAGSKASATSTTSAKPKRSAAVAVAVVAMLGTPLVYMLITAAKDGLVRAQEAPIRAMIGKSLDRFKAGESNASHYYGTNRSAPDFTLKDKEGLPWSLSDHRGKTVVLNFWSVTCPPCVKEMPSLIELAQLANTRDDLEVVAITTDESWAQVAHLFPRNSPLKVLFDSEKRVVEGKFGTKLFPETWVINGEGVIRMRYDGPFDWASAIALDAIDILGR